MIQIDPRVYEILKSTGAEAAFFGLAEKKQTPVGIKGIFNEIGFMPDGFYPQDEFFSPLKQAFSQSSVDDCSGFCEIIRYLYEKARVYYEKHGIPEDFYEDAIPYLAENTVYVWSCLLPALELFQIYGIQFKLCRFDYPDLKLKTSTVCKGQSIIQIHIPKGADISESNLNRAFARAAELFGTNIFTMDSWLLFEEHLRILPEKSRIKKFAERFVIIDSDLTYNYENTKRVFGDVPLSEIGKIQSPTLLQKFYADRISKNLPIGSAVGVFEFEK